MPTLLQKLKQAVKLQDRFARSVTFTIKGQDSFQSFCGGSVTIVILLGLLLTVTYQLYGVYSDPSYTVAPIKYDWNADKDTFELEVSSKNAPAFMLTAGW